VIDKFLRKLEGQNVAQIIILLILTPLPLFYFVDSNIDWSDVISKPMGFWYLFFCWVFGAMAYTSTKIDNKPKRHQTIYGFNAFFTVQKPVPIKSFLIAIGITSFFGFYTYHGFSFASVDDEYEDPYVEDTRIWKLQSKIDNLYSSIKDPLVDREEHDQIMTIEKQIKRIKENNRHNQAVANYIFYTLSIYAGLLIGRGGEFEKRRV
jgi:heme/copper-type cytochrome/quinol oxidase subunit 1